MPRRCLFHTLLLSLFLGYSLCLSQATDFWPFSQFALYAHGDFGARIEQFHLVGVQKDGTEIPLISTKHFKGLAGFPLQHHLHRARHREDYIQTLKRLHHLYREQRPLHGGPALSALKLLNSSWILKKDLSNLKQPEQTDLIAHHQVP